MKLLLHPATEKDIAELLAHPAHAVGIFGQDGAGKTAIVEHIVRSVLQLITLDEAPNVHRVDAGEGEGIAKVRDIRTFLSLKTAGTAQIRRVVIVEQAEKLSTDAQNALLKTLEEPPTDTMILLTAAEKSHLLTTILSRLRSIRIMPLPKQQCLAVEGYDQSELTKAYGLSNGFAGLFVGLLEAGTEHEMNSAVDAAKQFLSQQPYARLTQLEQIAKDKQQARLLLVGLQICLHAALRGTKSSSVAALHKKLELVNAAERRLNHSVQSKLLLTSLATQL